MYTLLHMNIYNDIYAILNVYTIYLIFIGQYLQSTSRISDISLFVNKFQGADCIVFLTSLVSIFSPQSFS